MVTTQTKVLLKCMHIQEFQQSRAEPHDFSFCMYLEETVTVPIYPIYFYACVYSVTHKGLWESKWKVALNCKGIILFWYPTKNPNTLPNLPSQYQPRCSVKMVELVLWVLSFSLSLSVYMSLLSFLFCFVSCLISLVSHVLSPLFPNYFSFCVCMMWPYWEMWMGNRYLSNSKSTVRLGFQTFCGLYHSWTWFDTWLR